MKNVMLLCNEETPGKRCAQNERIILDLFAIEQKCCFKIEDGKGKEDAGQEA